MAPSLASVTFESYEEPAYTSSLSNNDRIRLRHRRRHSSYHHWTADQEDNLQHLVDRFLVELGRRLDFLETYGQLTLDTGIEKALSTLHAVRDSCSHVSDEVIGAGRRRGKVLVDTLEERYKGVLAKKETMEQKVQEGISLMEGVLAEFEGRAYALRDARVAAANDFIDESKRKMDSGIKRVLGAMDDGLEKARRAKLNLKMKVDKAIKRARKQGLIKYEDLPDPWRGNPYITRGYRFCETKLECVWSVLTMSNEFFNIWSHIIGLMIILGLALYIYPSSPTYTLSTPTDILIASAFFISACKCLVCSTVWHTMSGIADQPLMERFACVDYTGISLLVSTSILTSEYTAFYCQPFSSACYMTGTIVLGTLGTILPWHPTFNRSDLHWFRVIFYCTLAATGFLPIFQVVWTRGAAWAYYFYAPVAKSVLVYLGGACLYAMQVPERWCPGMFDYVGGSHNIWHLAVVGGILFHYTAMVEFFKIAFTMREESCPAW